MGFKYVQGMPYVLDYGIDPWLRQKACLDLGCGSGSWYVVGVNIFSYLTLLRIIDVSDDFPATDNLGVDLVPMEKE
jgi:hypothetical protein